MIPAFFCYLSVCLFWLFASHLLLKWKKKTIKSPPSSGAVLRTVSYQWTDSRNLS